LLGLERLDFGRAAALADHVENMADLTLERAIIPRLT
jgi:hypothetical protein